MMSISRTLFSFSNFALSLGLLASGCVGSRGAEGPAGPQGDTGAMGTPGTPANSAATLIAVSAEPSQPLSSTSWSTIPGLSVTLNLQQIASVQLFGNGVQRTPDGQATTTCHVGYRFSIDGVAKGAADWGQRIQVSNGATSWHQTWSIMDADVLDAGQHTVELQAVQGGANVATCVVCGERDGSLNDHDGCLLNVIAVPQ
jgi:hypothetical protein